MSAWPIRGRTGIRSRPVASGREQREMLRRSRTCVKSPTPAKADGNSGLV
jgi:hypothetical protein